MTKSPNVFFYDDTYIFKLQFFQLFAFVLHYFSIYASYRTTNFN